MLKIYDRMPLMWLRERAVQARPTWMLEHLKGTGGLGAIYPAMANSIVALHCLGYKVDDPDGRARQCSEIEALEVYDTVSNGDNGSRPCILQPCHSPDLGYVAVHECAHRSRNAAGPSGLAEGGPPSCLSPNEEGRRLEGLVSHAEPGGWYFQFENEMYPDVDDSAVVLMALAKVRLDRRLTCRNPSERGTDGSWRCKGPMAAGAPTTKTTIGSCSTTFPLPTIMRCWIRARPT